MPSGFVPKGICLVYQSLRRSPLIKTFSVKDLQATIGINTKETVKADRHALKCVSGACVHPRKFLGHDKNGHRFRKTEFLFIKPVFCSFACFVAFQDQAIMGNHE